MRYISKEWDFLIKGNEKTARDVDAEGNTYCMSIDINNGGFNPAVITKLKYKDYYLLEKRRFTSLSIPREKLQYLK